MILNVKKNNKRKLFHQSLLAILVVLQILVLVFWYFENQTDKQVHHLSNEMGHYKNGRFYLDKANKALYDSQVYYKEYLKTSNKKALLNYYNAINQLKLSLKTFHDLGNATSKSENENPQIVALNQKMDAILNDQPRIVENSIQGLKFKTFDYNTILNSVSVDSIITNDSIARKGLVSRILAAISGKYNIKKEKLKIIVSYKYLNQLKTDDVKGAIENLLKESDAFYRNEIKQSRSTFFLTNKDELNLFKLNNEVLDVCSNILQSYSQTLHSLENDQQQQLQVLYAAHENKRNYILGFLVLLMLLFTFVLFYFTRLAFIFEKKLLTAQERILQNLSYKNRIVGMISHEIRSPLSVLSMYSRRVSAQVKDIEIKEVFKSIQYTTNTLLVMANQILEYSKNENTKMELKETAFNLKEELDKILTPITSLAESKGNILQTNINIDAKYDVYADAIKINQLFYNIVGNAIKFTENGTITVNACVTDIKSDRLSLVVDISDTGLGMNKEDLNAVFEEYYQGAVAHKKTNEIGVGLGMKICKEIIELFHGTIEITSELRVGTKVSFTLVLKLN